MEKNYYNKHVFLQILNQIGTNPYEALVRIKDYIYEYPLDKEGYFAYASVLIMLRRVDEALDK